MRFVVALVAALTHLAPAAAAAQGQVRLEDLGANMVPAAINNRGDVVGRHLGSAFIWSRAGGMRILMDDHATANDINDAGQVAVATHCDFLEFHCDYGAIWSEADGFTDLGRFAPVAINSQGDVVGVDYLGSGAIILRIRGQVVRTPLLGIVTDINDRREGTVNIFRPAVGPAIAVLEEDDTFTPLDVAGLDGSAVPRQINNKGTVIGVTTTVEGLAQSAVMWRGGRRITPNYPNRTVAYALNDLDVAVGGMSVGDRLHAMLWDPRRGVIDLGTLIGDQGSSVATDINEAGDVVGVSTGEDGLTHAVIWHVTHAGLTIQTPNTLSRWGINTRQRLAWTYDGDAPAFLIEINRDGGETWDFVANVPNKPGPAQNFYWTVTGPETAYARLRVTAVGDEEATDENDADIRIAPATINFILPNRSTVAEMGRTQTIFFSHNLGAEKPVAIDVSGDGGATWRTVVARALTRGADTSSFRWAVDLVPTGQARIRIRSLERSATVGISESFYVIGGAAGPVSTLRPSISGR